MLGLKKLFKPGKRVGGPANLSITEGRNEEQQEKKTIEGERSIPNVARRRAALSRPMMIGATALTLMAIAALSMMDNETVSQGLNKDGPKLDSQKKVTPRSSASLEPLDLTELTPVNPNTGTVPAIDPSGASISPGGTQARAIPVIPRNGSNTNVPAITASGSPSSSGAYPAYSQGSSGRPTLSPEEAWRKRRMEGGAGYERDETGGNAPAKAQFGGTVNPSESGSGQMDEYASKLRTSAANEVRATRVMDRNFLLARGKSTSCTTISRIDSTQPGQVTCVGDADVYSDNGNVLLFEKGTEYIGVFRGGLQQGQARVFILWEEARTPKGVKVLLASPAADSLGAAGVDGYVDNHFWQRFGGALMLSIVQDATARAGADQSAPATAGAGRDAASEAVRNSINIPPTLRKNHGQTVTIQIARDIDFRPVYGLEVAQ